MTTADGWVRCERGHDHWGLAGAAGILVRQVEDGVPRWLMQHRAPGTHHGDTWGIPGGALGWDETAEQGAWREATEEIGSLPADLGVRRTFTDDHGGWSYTVVLLEARARFTTSAESWETGDQGTRWCTREEIRALALHPGFAATAHLVLED